ncbi:HD domain-containing protein [Planctomicrobium sp. SH527]|uniref:HD domain-containing protein n=1 Tax=Planctomicrobium sp. SH527 TaxID=3448123 RepID=UPI003F5C891D
MADEKLRLRIISEAAQLVLQNKERDFEKARRKAARRIVKGYVRKDDMPTVAEIRNAVTRQSYLTAGDVRFDNLRVQRVAALNMMRRLACFHPRIEGNLVTGDVRASEGFEILLHEDDLDEVEAFLQDVYDGNVSAQEDVVLDPLAPVSSVTELSVAFCEHPGQCGVSLVEFERIVAYAYPDLDVQESIVEACDAFDRFEVFRMLLIPLQHVQQPRTKHPEGDALYHSLQVFELMREEYPYDEEVLLAALLHDVGKAIDPRDRLAATTNALAGFVTERTLWLIENLPQAEKLFSNTIGARARQRLMEHPDWEEVLTLARANRNGRVPGGLAPSLDEALEYIRELARAYG